MVRGPVSWIAQRPCCAAAVRAEISNTRAPSLRAAIMPVSALLTPGPVVTNTQTGRSLASEASAAAKAAPASWRKCRTASGPALSAAHSAATPPPDTS